MTNEQDKLLQQRIDEAEAAYEDGPVRQSLTSVDWFTPEYIIDAHDNEPYPAREGVGEFDDKALGKFLAKGYDLGKGNKYFVQIRNYLVKNMVGFEGHPLPLDRIPFANGQYLEFARSLGVNASHEVDRDMIQEVQWHLESLIAPEALRRKVIRVNAQWGEKNPQRKVDVLLWAELVKRGVKEYVAAAR